MANILELEKVRALIIEYAKNFDYEFTICRRKTKTTFEKPNFEDMIKHNCDTCGCVAGFTVCALPEENRWNNHIEQASAILDLTYNERKFLLFGRNPCIAKQDYYNYLSRYDYTENFHIEYCSQEEGRVEALKRIDFILEHYRKFSNALAP